MSDFPDFTHHYYQVEKELGHNRAGGRVTYLAIDIRSQQQVVIKQFQFAQLGSTWQSYDAYDREIQLLKELNHPGIPRYLASFQTDNGFCMVQEYKKAESLAVSRSFNPDEIRQIAIAALEVLIYLQNRIPPVIHRDIKPENILVDKASHVYLIDFGFARVGEGEVGVSSVVKGTLGFMPPEQLFNRQLTEASDLYGLGMSLICLLTGTKSDRIGDLVDISYRVSFKHLVPKLNIHWVNWLEKMVEPRLKDRFPNATAALSAIPNTPLRPPEAQFSQSTLTFKASHRREQLTQSVTITNPIPDTELQGTWEVATHPHDPPAEHYSWITVHPAAFAGNQIECQITVDTHLLMAGRTYSRQLLLHANTLAKTYTLNLQIQVAAVAVQANWRPYALLSALCLFSIITGSTTALATVVIANISQMVAVVGSSAILGSGIGLELSAWILRSSGWRIGATAGTLAAVIVSITGLIQILAGGIKAAGWSIIGGAIVGMGGGMLVGLGIGVAVEYLIAENNKQILTIISTLLTAILGTSLGIIWVLGAASLLPLSFVISSGLGLATIVLHCNLKRNQTVITQRKALRHLIKP